MNFFYLKIKLINNLLYYFEILFIYFFWSNAVKMRIWMIGPRVSWTLKRISDKRGLIIFFYFKRNGLMLSIIFYFILFYFHKWVSISLSFRSKRVRSIPTDGLNKTFTILIWAPWSLLSLELKVRMRKNQHLHLD